MGPLLPALILVLTDVARAACGLDQCPIPSPRPPAAQASARVDLGGYDASGVRGSWARGIVGAVVRPTPGLALHAAVPIQGQSVARVVDVGFGNAVVGGEVAPANEAWRPVVGAQLELPTGSRGVTEAHWAAMPYGGVRWLRPSGEAPVWFDARIGVRTALDTIRPGPAGRARGTAARAVVDHGESTGTTTEDGGDAVPPGTVVLVEAPHIVEPHEHLEAVGRVTVGVAGDWSPSVGLDAVRVLGASEGPRTVVDAAVAVGRRVTPRSRWTVNARVPLTWPGRFSWWLGTELAVTLAGPAAPTDPRATGR